MGYILCSQKNVIKREIPDAMDKKNLRSLSGLIDFECAARHASFKLAAEELHKTPAAVSLQVKQLEEAVGFALFRRHPRHIALTEKGQDLALTVTRMLDELRGKVAALRGGDEEKILRISTTYSLALRWLVPRIPRFTLRYPELDLRIDSSDKLVNLEDDNIDVALRGQRAAEGDPDMLFRNHWIAVYSPSLLQPGQDALGLADLKRFPLLYGETTEVWQRLLKANGVHKGRYDFSRGFSNLSVIAQAVLAGQGIGQLTYAIGYDDIRSGALRVLPCRGVPHDDGYYFLTSRRKRELPKVQRFRAWLEEEIAEMEQSMLTHCIVP